jgi:hypothetical protein
MPNRFRIKTFKQKANFSFHPIVRVLRYLRIRMDRRDPLPLLRRWLIKVTAVTKLITLTAFLLLLLPIDLLEIRYIFVLDLFDL